MHHSDQMSYQFYTKAQTNKGMKSWF